MLSITYMVVEATVLDLVPEKAMEDLAHAYARGQRAIEERRERFGAVGDAPDEALG